MPSFHVRIHIYLSFNLLTHSFLATSSYVTMKFLRLSYTQMVHDAVLTAQFVQTLPVYISKSLNISTDDVIVVTITSAPAGSKRKRSTDSGDGVIVSMAIPSDEVPKLQDMIKDRNSTLYSPNNGQLASLVDPSYFVANTATSGNVSSRQSVDDPNSPTSSSSSGGGLSKGALIGICVSVGIIVYAAATVVVYKVYQRKKAAKEQQAMAEHEIFAQSISEPIMQDNSLGWNNSHMIPQPPHLAQYRHYGNASGSNHQW